MTAVSRVADVRQGIGWEAEQRLAALGALSPSPLPLAGEGGPQGRERAVRSAGSIGETL